MKKFVLQEIKIEGINNEIHEELTLRRSGRVVHTIKWGDKIVSSSDVEDQKAIRIMNRMEQFNQTKKNMEGTPVRIGKNTIKIVH